MIDSVFFGLLMSYVGDAGRLAVRELFHRDCLTAEFLFYAHE